ncbi:MAG TPA: DUF2238 domain-containing protein [Acidimicrobiales bacterium]|nr:DUF2238 domain-containing protein [Acidimicrobiales bacterium]
MNSVLGSRCGRFTAGYLVLFGAVAAGRGDRRYVAYLLVVAALGLALRRAHRTARFPTPLCGALAVCGLLHMSGGLLPSPSGAPVLYETWLVPGLVKYDQLVHFSISAVLTVAVWHLAGAWVDRRRCGPWAQAMLAVLVALGFGALNEAFEFLSALRIPTFVGGADNTGWDLVFNGFGAVAAGVWLACSAVSPAPVAEGVPA